MSETIKFPSNFYFGASTSAHQVEGGNINDWSEWEKSKKRIDYLKSKGLAEKYGLENFISGMAADHYNRFEEDFKLAKKIGHNATRFSIEWSRIEPRQGEFNKKEIEHYREVIFALRKMRVEPFVTLWHWTNPLWVSEIGGWENKKTIKYFLNYADKIVNEIGEGINFWIPINEPTIYVGMSYVTGVFPPQVKSFLRANNVLKNLISAYKQTFNLIHQKLGEKARIGNANNIHYYMLYRKNNILDIMATKIINYIRDTRSLRWTCDYEDFIGLNYYYRDTVKFSLTGGKFYLIDIKNPNDWVSDLGWDIYPKGIYYVLKNLAKYHKPIYITENGLADATDQNRKRFIKEHLYWIGEAIREGVDVRGYFHWSLLDNFEWDKGFWPRFGLVEVDYRTMERKIRPSAYYYKELIKEYI